MEATDILMAEHRIIERALKSLVVGAETGEGIHEKYLTLAQALEKEAGNQ